MDDTGNFTPIFVVGSARSGTTLVAKLVSSSNLVQDYRAETLIMSVCRKKYGNIFTDGLKRNQFLSDWLKSRQFKRSNLDEHEFKSILSKSSTYPDLLVNFLRGMSEKASKSYIVDSTPANLNSVSEIKERYPNAKFIHVVRDGRDVAISQEKLGWTSPPLWFKSRADRLHYSLLNWKINNEGLARKSLKNIITIKYEDFVSNPEVTLSLISEFLSISSESFDLAASLDPSKSNSAFGSLGNESNQSAISRWKSVDTSLLENYTYGCISTLSDLGYPVASVSHNPFLRLRYTIFNVTIRLRKFLTKFYIVSSRTSESLEFGD